MLSVREARNAVLPWLAAALALAALLSPIRGVLAAVVTWPQQTNLVLPGTGITLKIDAGAQADSLTINPSSFTVVVAAAETFTVRYPGPSYGTMTNDGGINDCNIVGSDNVSIVNGPKTVTFTPSTSTCTPPAPGGGGGGGGSAPPSVRLYAPNGGETILGGSVYKVFWTYTGSQTRSVALSLSLDGGTFELKASTTAYAQGYYDLTMPTPTADAMAKMRIELLGDAGSVLAVDESDGAFMIDVADATSTPVTPPAGALPEPFDPTATIASDKGLPQTGTPLALFCGENELIKLEDDGNALTQYDSAVYYCGRDGKRYVFPNAKVYATWYADFSRVHIVTAAQLVALPLGGNVTYRPGTRLLKIQSDPKVYAVDHGGLLRPIPDEATARALFGPAWNTLIDDIDVAFFVNYRIGPPLAAIPQ